MAQSVRSVRRCSYKTAARMRFLAVKQVVCVRRASACTHYGKCVPVRVVGVARNAVCRRCGQAVVEVVGIRYDYSVARLRKPVAAVIVCVRYCAVVACTRYRFADEPPKVVVEVGCYLARVCRFRRNVAVGVVGVCKGRRYGCARVVRLCL